MSYFLLKNIARKEIHCLRLDVIASLATNILRFTMNANENIISAALSPAFYCTSDQSKHNHYYEINHSIRITLINSTDLTGAHYET